MSESSILTEEMEQLEARRRQLAFEVGQGREDLEPELDAVEDQLARLKRGQERRALAEAESATRAQEAAQAQAEATRQKLEAQLAEGTAARLVAARHVEAAMAELEGALGEYLEAGSSLYSTSAGLGRPRPRIAGVEALAAYLSWRLHGFLPHDFARPMAHAQRKGLVELLGGEPASPAEAPRVKRRGRH